MGVFVPVSTYKSIFLNDWTTYVFLCYIGLQKCPSSVLFSTYFILICTKAGLNSLPLYCSRPLQIFSIPKISTAVVFLYDNQILDLECTTWVACFRLLSNPEVFLYTRAHLRTFSQYKVRYFFIPVPILVVLYTTVNILRSPSVLLYTQYRVDFWGIPTNEILIQNFTRI